MNKNIAFALPENLSKKIIELQKEMNLKTPGEVILKALSLLELSMGREVDIKDEEKKYRIKSFENYMQSIKIDNISSEDNNGE